MDTDWTWTESSPALAPSFVFLLQYASLRGPYALLDSSLPPFLYAIPDFLRKPFAPRATAILRGRSGAMNPYA